ncbi:MAG: type III-B CRISPR-associated protein Cas10/Cmr2 [Candidatus Korarchaeum sp.]
MMEEEFWSRKLCSLLHDPPLKAFRISGHRKLAKELSEAFNIGCENYEEYVQLADWSASASDRIPCLRSPSTIEWSPAEARSKAVIYHPLSGGVGSGNLLSEHSEILVMGRDGASSIDHRNLKEVVAELSSNHPNILSQMKDKLSEKAKGLNDARKKFLWLWRNMEHLSKEEWFRGFILSWLPVETRLPDHSIYDHLITTSALTIGEPVLVGVDIGGVQAFIEQSRKVRDLWASSYIVSMLSMSAMMIVVEKLGPDSVIYPDLRGVPIIDLYLFMEGVLNEEDIKTLWPSLEKFSRSLLIPSIPGSFVFIAPGSEVDEILREIEDRVNCFFEKLVGEVLGSIGINTNLRDKLPHPLSLRHYKVSIVELEPPKDKSNLWLREPEGDRDKIKEKLKSVVPKEIYESFEKDGRNLLDHIAELVATRNEMKVDLPILGTFLYQVAYTVLKMGISSQKLTSDFSYAEEPSVEGGVPIRRRCMLCGLRNPVVVGGKGWADIVEDLRRNEERRWAGFLLEVDEPLCPICLTKRLLRSFHGDKGPLLTLWSIVLGKDKDAIMRALKRLGIEKQVRDASTKIPTIDDIAANPIKRRIAERIGSDAELSSLWDEVVSEMIGGVKIAIETYFRSETGSDAWRQSSYIISEISRWPELLEKKGEFANVPADFIEEKLREELKDPEKVPGTYYFPSVWENLLTSLSEPRAKSALNGLLEKLKEFYRRLGDEPSNYVTYILSDGDRIGHWISGRMFLEKGITVASRLHPDLKLGGLGCVVRMVTPSLHRTISRIIRGLAQEIYPYLIESLDGFVFYSGGDDLLAVIPASNTLRLLETLYSCYSAEIVKIQDQGIFMSMGRLATLSSGVVIAHRLLPMFETLEKLREEVKSAKGEGRQDGRDRSSLVRLTRGLSEERASLAGGLLRVQEEPRLGEGADLVLNGIKEGKLSKSFLRDLLYYLELYGMVYNSPKDGKEFLNGLIRRAVKRNLKVTDDEERRELERKVVDFYSRLSEIDAEVSEFDQHPLVNFQRFLLMISREVV